MSKTEVREKSRAALQKAITLVGNQAALARLCGNNVTQSHIHNWLTRDKRGVPAEYVRLIEQAVNGAVTCYELRSDIYPPPEMKKS